MAFLVHQLLSESAERYPDKSAIFYKDQASSYAELEKRASMLAHELVELGVKKGDRVGIYMKRGISPVVAAFGILKMGGAYVPIDPMCPAKRFEYIVRRCEMKTLFTNREGLKNLKGVFSDKIPFDYILLEDGLDQCCDEGGSTHFIDCQRLPETLGIEAPSVDVIDSDVAYILFTSGSTGDPKGVMISHLNALTFVNTAHDFFKINANDRLSNIASMHFDMSVFDIFVAIKAGAAIVIIPENIPLFPTKLAQIIAESKISVWNSVPSALTILAGLTNLNVYDFSNLRYVLFAGEIFPLKYLRRLKENMPQARFCNMYGQTEANSSTFYWVEDIPADNAGPLPIGKPLPNFDVFAIDASGERVIDTEKIGELYVRASSVAIGYLGQQEQTDRSFVNNPLKTDQHEKVYRTGDLVRLDPHGNYVFCGRRDHMIKSRGYRIEIEEIETVLLTHSGVKTAAVIPIPDEIIGNRIFAVVVPTAQPAATREDILVYCSDKLPQYMLPEFIEFRDLLPMTTSGKIDRKALSADLSETWASSKPAAKKVV